MKAVKDNTLSWGGGDHVVNSSGPGDKPMDKDAKFACATDGGRFGRDASAYLRKPVTPPTRKAADADQVTCPWCYGKSPMKSKCLNCMGTGKVPANK